MSRGFIQKSELPELNYTFPKTPTYSIDRVLGFDPEIASVVIRKISAYPVTSNAEP